MRKPRPLSLLSFQAKQFWEGTVNLKNVFMVEWKLLLGKGKKGIVNKLQKPRAFHLSSWKRPDCSGLEQCVLPNSPATASQSAQALEDDHGVAITNHPGCAHVVSCDPLVCSFKEGPESRAALWTWVLGNL